MKWRIETKETPLHPSTGRTVERAWRVLVASVTATHDVLNFADFVTLVGGDFPALNQVSSIYMSSDYDPVYVTPWEPFDETGDWTWVVVDGDSGF